jgi:broad specificity phosphatase PhoE
LRGARSRQGIIQESQNADSLSCLEKMNHKGTESAEFFSERKIGEGKYRSRLFGSDCHPLEYNQLSLSFQRKVVKCMRQTIWIARHANRQDFVKPEWFTKTANFRYDPPLSKDGFLQAKQLANRLQNEPIKYIFASPFLRTIQTANAIAEILDLSIKLEWGLGEWLNPDWMTMMPETRTLETLTKFYPRIDQTYKTTPPHYPETEAECLKRGGDTAKKLIDNYPDNMLLIGHGASVIGATMGLIPNIRPDDINSKLCCLVKLIHQQGDWVMELNGDTSHLSQTETNLRFN